jgi:hypothetical protein
LFGFRRFFVLHLFRHAPPRHNSHVIGSCTYISTACKYIHATTCEHDILNVNFAWICGSSVVITYARHVRECMIEFKSNKFEIIKSQAARLNNICSEDVVLRTTMHTQIVNYIVCVASGKLLHLFHHTLPRHNLHVIGSRVYIFINIYIYIYIYIHTCAPDACKDIVLQRAKIMNFAGFRGLVGCCSVRTPFSEVIHRIEF